MWKFDKKRDNEVLPKLWEQNPKKQRLKRRGKKWISFKILQIESKEFQILKRKWGKKIDSLFCKFFYYVDKVREVTIHGEITPIKGTKILHDIELKADIFDESNRIIERGNTCIYKKEFDTFESFLIDVYDVPDNPFKIRLYPINKKKI